MAWDNTLKALYIGRQYDSTVTNTNATKVINLATASETGIAKFNTNVFVVDSAGDVILKDGGVASTKIADNAITNAKMYDDAVDSAEIADGAVDLVHMSVNSVDSNQYVDGSIDTAHIANDAITADLIVDNIALAGNPSSVGNFTVGGNLIVSGDTTTLNTATLSVEDLNITCASGAADSSAADGAGLTVAGASATITYTHSGTKWNMNKGLDIVGTLEATGGIVNTTLDFGTYAN